MTADTSSTPLLDLLAAERAALVAAVERVPEAERSRRPAPDRWSIAEVIEHLARVVGGVAKLLAMRGRESPPALDEAARAAVQLDAARIARLRNRAERIEAPPRIHPTGTVSVSDAMLALEASRAALIAAFTAADPASLDTVSHAHAVLGTLSLRGWVAFVAHHEARHAEQISEIAATLAGD